MKNIERDFVELTKRAIIQDTSDDGFFDATNWEKMLELACNNKLMGVCYDVAKNQKSLPEDIRKRWDYIKFQIFVRQKKHFHILIDLIREIEAAGIDYAIFKGIVVADVYPEPAFRPSSDSDILVDESDRAKVCQMIEKRGYILDEHKTKEHVSVYKNESTAHVIELHTTVYEDYEGRKIDMLKAADLESPAKRISVTIDGEDVRTFGHNEHLVYMMFHIIKHFMLEGADVKFFTDITLFVNAHLDELSSEYFWSMMDSLGYGFFCENFMGICVKYFGMTEVFVSDRQPKASEAVLEAMIVDFIYQGDEEHLRSENWQLTTTLEPYLVGERTAVKKSKTGRVIRFIFPKPSELNDSYSYAKKYPLLLPAAWIHRAVKKIIWQLFEKKEQYSAVEKINVVESRLGLMASVGLLDEE